MQQSRSRREERELIISCVSFRRNTYASGDMRTMVGVCSLREVPALLLLGSSSAGGIRIFARVLTVGPPFRFLSADVKTKSTRDIFCTVRICLAKEVLVDEWWVDAQNKTDRGPPYIPLTSPTLSQVVAAGHSTHLRLASLPTVRVYAGQFTGMKQDAAGPASVDNFPIRQYAMSVP